VKTEPNRPKKSKASTSAKKREEDEDGDEADDTEIAKPDDEEPEEYAGPAEGAAASVLEEEIEADEPDAKAESMDFKEDFDDDDNENVQEEAAAEDDSEPTTKANAALTKTGKHISELLQKSKKAALDDDDDEGDDEEDESDDVDEDLDDDDELDEDDDAKANVGSKRSRDSGSSWSGPAKKQNRGKRDLAEEDVRNQLFAHQPMTMKALISKLKDQFDMHAESQNLVTILRKIATVSTDPSSQEKVLKLKQS